VPSLVDTLTARQAAAGMDDAAFAAKLGVSRAAWSMVRAGKRQMGDKLLSGVMKAFPSLADDCLAYLRDRSYAVPSSVTDGDDPYVTPEHVA
jgi:hypothetical protein